MGPLATRPPLSVPACVDFTLVKNCPIMVHPNRNDNSTEPQR